MATVEQQDILNALAAAAVDLQMLMPDAADVVRPTLAGDGFGGQTATDVTVAAGVPARVSALTGQELATANKVAAYATYAVTVPPATDVRVHDALVVAGVRYEVQYVPAGTFRAQLRCLCSVVA